VELSKLKILDRETRAVQYTLDGKTYVFRLRSDPGCSASVVQKKFNKHIEDGNNILAISEVERTRWIKDEYENG
jgi:hypothetical protein